MKKQLIMFGTVALTALAIAANQAVALKRTPKVGDKATYQMVIDLDFQGQAVNVKFDAVHTVTKVNDDGSYVQTEENKNQVVMVGGQEMPGAGQEENSTMTYAADGTVLKVEATTVTGDEHRLSNLMTTLWPESPVDVKSKWERTIRADSAKGTPEVVHKYEVLAREEVFGFTTLKIAYNAAETGDGGAASTGTAWVDVKTGLAVKVAGAMQRAPIMGMPMDAKFEMSLKR